MRLPAGQSCAVNPSATEFAELNELPDMHSNRDFLVSLGGPLWPPRRSSAKR